MSVLVAACFRTVVAASVGATGAAGTTTQLSTLPSCEVLAYTQYMRLSGNILTFSICGHVSISISTEALTDLGAALAGPGSELVAFSL
jgi:hypothetical protein